MEENLLQKTILFEMEGKNQAIHEYDKMIWALRTGYLTVFFGIWGLIFKSLLDNGLMCQSVLILKTVTILAVLITFGALAVDINYVSRKYKVIRAINLLYNAIIKNGNAQIINPEDFKDLILISGTTRVISEKKDQLENLKHTGYSRELFVSIIVYLIPLTALIIGWIWLMTVKF